MFRDKYGPWALIAGGSVDIGLHIGKRLAADGVNLVITGRTASRLETAAAELRQAGVEVRTVATDMSRPGAADAIVEATQGLEIGFLAYVAGSVKPARFLDQDLGEVMAITQLNALTPVELCHHYLPAMAARRRGAVILGGSGAAVAGSYGFAAYAAAKAYQMMLGESLWYEMRQHNVDVINILIAGTRTEGAASYGVDFDNNPDVFVMEPVDVANAALDQLLADKGPTVWPCEHYREFDAPALSPDRRAATKARSSLFYTVIHGEAPAAFD